MIPKVLFLIPAQYLPFVVNVIGDIMQLIPMRFHYRPRHYAYPELFGQLLISVQVLVPLLADGEELRVFGHPIGEMVFRENSELGTLGSGGSYELGRS